MNSTSSNWLAGGLSAGGQCDDSRGRATEFALAFWLWFRPTRRWVILAGVLLHAGIRPVLNIPGFGEIMCTTYLTFLDPDEVATLIGSLDPRRWLARLGVRWPNLGFLQRAAHRSASPLGSSSSLPSITAEVHAAQEAVGLS